MQTPKTFSLEVEKVALDKNINHLDAVIWYCQKNELEPDSVGRLITKGLKEKIEANARELNFLDKSLKKEIFQSKRNFGYPPSPSLASWESNL